MEANFNSCQFCQLQFKGEIALKSHLQRLHYYCQRCDKKCEDIQAFLRHCKEDHVFNQKCEKCNMKFLTSEELEKHDKAEHLPLDCNLCEYKGKTKDAIRKHMIVHSEIEIKCQFCSYTAKRKGQMNRHLDKCGPEVIKHCCESCTYKVPTEMLLVIHMKNVHGSTMKKIVSTPGTATPRTEQRKWKCEFCSYQTHDSKSRRQHVDVCGESVDMFECEVEDCSYRVPTISLMRMHKGRIHNSKECQHCSYKSTHSEAMRNHGRICGPNIPLVSCEHCEYKVPTDTLLRTHMSKIHMDMNFTPRQKSRRSLQIDSQPPGEFKCTNCDHVEQYEFDLQLHFDRNHGEKKKCLHCDFESKFRHRMEDHYEKCNANALFHQCELCEYKNSDKGSFTNHLKHKHKIHNSQKQVKDKGPKIQCEFCSYESIEQNMNHHGKICGPDVDKFTCEFEDCESKYPTPMLFKRHIMDSHPQAQKKKCDKCRYETFTDSLLKCHSDIVHAELVKCPFCDFVSKITSDIEQHTEACGPDVTMFSCDKCHKYNVSCKETFENHTCKDPNLGRKKCQFCDFMSRDNGRLASHMESCGPAVQMFQCDHCSFQVSSERSLDHHMSKSHQMTKQYDCNHCSFVTSLSKYAKDHHDKCGPDVIKYTCGLCEFKAISEYVLNRHKSKSHGIKAKLSYKCEFCDYKASSSDSLKKHQKYCTVDSPKHFCPTCQFKAGTLYLLTSHISKEHGRKTKCDFCDFESENPSHLRKHEENCFISDEKFVCEIEECKKEFVSKFVLLGHIRSAHENPKKRKAEETLENIGETKKIKQEILVCDQCNFTGHSEIGLNAHKTVKHEESGKGQWIVKLVKLNFALK